MSIFYHYVPGCALRLIFGGALDRSGQVAILDQRLEAKFDLFLERDLFVLDVATFPVIFVAFLLLLRRVIRFVGGVTPFRVAVLAVDDLIVFGLFGHDHFVHASLAGGRYGADVQRLII